ncbi:hypothetical protein Lal_00032947 [Lupinus albus]|nr:hypothetical protein Lal_00032947 [Lupinus albus]
MVSQLQIMLLSHGFAKTVKYSTIEKAWNVLATTYANPTRGHFKHIKIHLSRIAHSAQSITSYMQSIKHCIYRLASMGKPMDHEDIIENVLFGLNYEQYKSVIDAVNDRDTSIIFEELHEKVTTKEITPSVKAIPSNFSAIVNTAQYREIYHLAHAPRQQHPYLGKCQWCREQGHSLSNCPSFKGRFPTFQVPAIVPNCANERGYQPRAHVPQANVATATHPPSNGWLLDSGVSHHVTNDLSNLSLHAPCDNTEELMIGDGSTLPIQNTGPFFYFNFFYKIHIFKCIACSLHFSQHFINLKNLSRK